MEVTVEMHVKINADIRIVTLIPDRPKDVGLMEKEREVRRQQPP